MYRSDVNSDAGDDLVEVTGSEAGALDIGVVDAGVVDSDVVDSDDVDSDDDVDLGRLDSGPEPIRVTDPIEVSGAIPETSGTTVPMTPAEHQPGLLLPPPSQPRRSATRRAALAGGLAGAIVAAGVSFAVAKAVDNGPKTVAVATGGATNGSSLGTSTLGGQALDIHQLVENAGRSVVSIETGAQQTRTVFGVGAGSGVIVSADGLVLTNDHVVADADVFKVRLTDGRSFEAELVGTAPSDDLALLRLKNASGLTPAVLGDSDALRVGDDVVAIGNALDLEGDLTVTRGIVSAKNRTLPEGNGATLEGVLQTDAAINPGNSGGALFNAAGEVIGIPTAVSGQAQNIGFAIPSSRAKLLIEDLKLGGTTNPNAGFLGISAEPVSSLSESAKARLGIDSDTTGLVITELSPGAAAESAGLQQGDVLTKVGDAAIASQGDLGLAVRSHAPGDKVTITYVRDGKTATVEATLGSRPVAT
jgi:S1-C subfamily serine protease